MNSFKSLIYGWLLLLLFLGSSAQAQLGTPRYSFQSRSQLRVLLLQNKSNSRALYDLATLAHRRGWLGTAINTGDELLAKNKNDVHAQALIAYCVFTGLYARDWNWPVDQTAGDLWSRQSTASFLQSQSLKVQAPAIQLMAAISKANLPTSREFDEALRLFRLVLKRQPNWADAHYWYGRAIDRASTQKSKLQRQQDLRKVLSEYKRAEQLDKGLHFPLLQLRSGPLEELGKPRESLAAFNGYLQAYPAFGKDLEERFPGYVAKKRAGLIEQIR